MSNPSFSHAESWGRRFDGSSRRQKREEKTSGENLVQPIDIYRFGRENPRKSKENQPPKAGVFVGKRGRSKKTQTRSTNGVAAAVEKERNLLHPKARAL